ncbi:MULTISPECIES: lactonase family protein [Paraburkholderia]|uniref:lactonase family protein n=1 Tax=Paraburkholderia TaxID=1822464 RepID=UPI001CB3610F|nr:MULTISPECIES: beta-propeller fold lactonase family protein [Paraburkholderia]GJH05765.1 beta-propeller fold lactonase family protein [Paraburkholderia terrae]CAG9241155.1 6-phosphogluconolactonase [Paraburkholderia caribensis]
MTFFAIVSNAVDGDLAVFRVDGSTGGIAPVARHPAGDTVMPLALSADGRVLHAATRGAQRSIVTYSVDPHTGSLAHLRTASIEPSLAYLSLTPSDDWLLGASYGESSVSLYPASPLDSTEIRPRQVVEGFVHAHAVIASADGRFAYATSLGSDTVFCFSIVREANDAALELVQKVPVEAGFGPRHLRLSPDEKTLYVSSEFRATVAVFSRDDETGALSARSVSPRAPSLAHLNDGCLRTAQIDAATAATLVWGADIQLTPDGRFVYVAERTSSRLIAYRVTHEGSLEYAGFTDTEAQPRGFRIDPSGRFLVACGERSAQVVVYAIDADSGALSAVSRCEGGRGANWVEIVMQT